MDSEATRVIVVRHGETDWNAALRIQGHTDIDLNARGQWQAAQLAQALAEEPVAAVYASDLLRAFHTARACAERWGLAVQPALGLRERHFGRFEGLSFPEIEGRWPEDAQRWRQRDPAFAPLGGESLADFYARCTEAAGALAARHRGQSILLVAHGGVLDCLYRAATRAALNAPRSWKLANATINRLLHSEGGFALVGWDDAGHLEAPAPA